MRGARTKKLNTQSAQSLSLIAVRLWSWGLRDRQILRGIQRFAHSKPRWRLYVDLHAKHGELGSSRLLNGDLSLDGIITNVLFGAERSWKRVVNGLRSRVVSITSIVPSEFSSLASARINEINVASAIGRHLLSGGFRELAYIGIRKPNVEDTRLEAFSAFAKSEGCPCHFLTNDGPLSTSMVSRWIVKLPKPIGLLAWNMFDARIAIEACRRAGVAVPEQVAVVSGDDDPMLAETLEPTISAAGLPFDRLGYEAARLLDQIMGGSPIPNKPVLVEPTNILHVRQSSDVTVLKDRDVHLALQYIREHGTESLKVSHIAHALRISRSKLERELVRVTGRTPHETIEAVRLDRARQLLAETEWPLARVAESCGMGTEETLRRLFLKHEQMTPGSYRIHCRGT